MAPNGPKGNPLPANEGVDRGECPIITRGVILDYDENDQVVGTEFLNVSSRVAEGELALMQFQTA